MNRETLIAHVVKTATESSQSVFDTDCELVIYLLEHCEITVSEKQRFCPEINCIGVLAKAAYKRAEAFEKKVQEHELSKGQEVLAFTGNYDFSHTTTEWKSVLSLGIWGLRKRIAAYAQKYAEDVERTHFYEQLLRVYDAALHFIKRAADEAEAAGKMEMAKGLLHLTQAAPQNLFEVMQTMLMYYKMQMSEGTALRTLGRLDTLFYPYFEKEEETKAEELLVDFLKEIDALKATANIPFALCGTDVQGRELINTLSYRMLRAYKKAHTQHTKLHILCSKNTPKDILEEAFEGIREGNNSIVFMSDTRIIEALEKLGEDKADAVDYHVVGCYECGGNGELTCSCNARVNLVKALELTLNQGKDMMTDRMIGLESSETFDSFEQLYEAYKRQLQYLCVCAMKVTDMYEQHYSQIHASPILSGTYQSALEKGGDLYCHHSAKYPNSSVNGLGLGTTVDALAAIRKLVYEDKQMSIQELTEILRSNWEGKEALRNMIKNKYPKYGVGDAKTDALARDIVKNMASWISGKPNMKGGKYRLGLFSIDWRWDFGAKTAASADGRLAGESLSQNTSASFGADKEGATGHMLSVVSIDSSDTPNGAVVDIDLHRSAAEGTNGLQMLVGTLKTFFDLGGFAIQYNILDTETLKKAKINPDAYPNLQVRLCGWNVLFSSLSDREKEEFIERFSK